MNKKDIVRLTEDERNVCQAMVKKLKGSSEKVRRAQILLKADADGPAWLDVKIAEAFDCRVQTVEKLRRRLVTEGFEHSLERKKRPEPPRACKLDGAAEAKLIAMRVGKAPSGVWTLDAATARRRNGRLRKRRFDQLRDNPQDAKKNGLTTRKIEYGVIPPEQDAEFVASMEDVLETYAKASDPKHPVLCMDEQPVQLLKETQVPIPATRRHGKRVDYAYERNGTASMFMCAEPLSGYRQATARPHRTKADWAIETAHILDTRYANNAIVTLVCDNLNTHTKGAFYEVLAPARARAYVKRLDFRYTPKHGSWLHVAECELSGMTSQCLSDRRIAEVPELQSEIMAWSNRTNAKQRAVDWQFRIEDARVKLKRLYPKIKV